MLEPRQALNVGSMPVTAGYAVLTSQSFRPDLEIKRSDPFLKYELNLRSAVVLMRCPGWSFFTQVIPLNPHVSFSRRDPF